MEEKKQLKTIDIIDISKKLWARKRLYAITLPVAFLLACLYIFSIPRYYTSEVKLAPELGGSSSSSMLGSLASSFGFDLSDMQNSDAITPLLYPDLMEDNGFVTSLFGIKVRTMDGTVNTTYYDYLKKHQKVAWWSSILGWTKNLFKSGETADSTAFDPYILTKPDDDVASAIRNSIKVNFDKKTALITIGVQAQDRLVCKIVADSVMERLQQFIIEYRTSKARNDYDYYKQLTDEARLEYEEAMNSYARSSDANSQVVLKSVSLKLEDMENMLQMKYTAFTTLSTQLQTAKAKVQERTPAITLVKGAAAPLLPAGPKRMLFVLAVIILTFLATSVYIYYTSVIR